MRNFYNSLTKGVALSVLLAFCMTVGAQAAGQKKYRVLYEKTFIQGSGYTIKANPTGGTITSGADADVLVVDTTATVNITADNIGDYIQPREVAGYETGLYVNLNEAQLGYAGNIYVNYYTKAETKTWNDGTFEYSTKYIRTTGTEVNMPDDECAVSLYFEPKEVTDEVTYRIFKYTTKNVYSGRTTYRTYYRVLSGTSMKAIAIISQYDSYPDDNLIFPVNDNFLNNISEFSSSYSQEEVYTDCWLGTYDHTFKDGHTQADFQLNGSSIQLLDDDNDGFGEYATYELADTTSGWQYYNTIGGNRNYVKEFKYKRTHTMAYSDKRNVVIPKVDPTYGRKVTAIQKWGFCYKKKDVLKGAACAVNADGSISENITRYYFWEDDHSNEYLETVKFEEVSNMKSIGDYAFMSCIKLTDIDIPHSVEYLGQGIFEMDVKLKNVNFQSYQNKLETKIKTIKNFTFWLCTSIETLNLPDGITEIEGQQSGASLQYMTSLTTINLPNTLLRIGPHFLCCSASLVTLTIPNSVEYIDGASFHGCEQLKTVYMLGPASALQPNASTGASNETFSSNVTFCLNRVENCTFYTTPEYLPNYQKDAGWSLIDGKNGNTLTEIPEVKRSLQADVWVTALFPYGVENISETFGTGTLVAELDEKTAPGVELATSDVDNGKIIRKYNMHFKLLEGNSIAANRPVLIKPAQDTEHVFYNQEDQDKDENFKANSSVAHSYYTTAEDGAVIVMSGRYLDYLLNPWDFYFLYKNKTQEGDNWTYDANESPKFYRVPSQDKAPTIKACRCYWTIYVNGYRADVETTTAKNVVNDELTGINDLENVETRVVIEGIYDLQGRKLNIAEDELPRGIFIINGKKTAVK